MKKDFVSVFNKDIAIDEYELDNLLDKNIEVKENEFPTILIDREDDTNKYININNNSNFNSNENIITEINENKMEDSIINTIETNETENIITENKINDLSEAYTEEENNLYNEAKNNISLTEDDLTDIENVEEFNLEDAVFGSKDNDIYKNNSEKSNMQEIDLMEEDNLKKEDEILEYEDKEVIVPAVDNVDYIDESDYIKSINSNNEVIELSGNELDLITKDKDINEDKENIIVSDDNMRKDNFVLEEQTIENETAHIDDIENNKEKEEEEKTNYYINKFKKMHEEYVKSIEENKESENNKVNNETEIKEEITENKNIENIEEEKLENVEIEKVENIEEVNKIESPTIEEPEEIKEELETTETEATENIIEEIKEEDDLETTDKLSVEEEEMYKAYLGDDANLIEEVEDIIPEETEEKEEEAPLMNTLEITDILSAEEEEMYKAYLGDDSNSIEEIEDLIPKENEEINMELEIAKNELKKKEETLSKLEIIGELSAEEESIFDDILQQNKNRYYEDDINNADIILKDLNLDEIEEINENDFNILENFILGKEPEEGIELISINNENDSNKNDDNQIKSIEDFDSIDSEELLNAKETKMPEEKELKIEEQNIDLNAKVDEEFSLNKDDSILTNEKINQRENGKEDFDGEITQMDLDLAEKLFETGDQKNNEDYGPKHDLLLSENDIVKFRKLFSYFKIIVDKLPKESLNDFSKTEFYDTYSSLFRKFGE